MTLTQEPRRLPSTVAAAWTVNVTRVSASVDTSSPAFGPATREVA